MDTSLIIIGTPSLAWFEPSLALASRENPAEQERFRQSLDECFGADSHDAPLKGIKPQQFSKLSRSILSTGGAPHFLTDLRACWLGKSLIEGSAKASVLAFYSSPEEFLAALPEESDPLQALEVWKESARCLLELIRSHRSRITLLSVEECYAAPEAFNSLLDQKYSLKTWGNPSRSELDAVRLALGKMQSQSDPHSKSILAELNAASQPFLGDNPPRVSEIQALDAAWHHLKVENAARIDERTQALSSLKNLEIKHKEALGENKLLLDQLLQVQEKMVSTISELKGLEVEIEQEKKNKFELEGQIDGVKKELEAAKAMGGEVEKKSAEFEAKLKDSEEESDLLLLQLHQAQEELESTFVKLKGLEVEIEQEKKNKFELEGQIDGVKKELDAAKAMGGALEKIKFEHKETIEENKMLLLQLHQVQEELEHYFYENKRLEKQRLQLASDGSRLLRVDGLRLGHCHDTPPHRHLDFTLENAVLGARELGTVRLRLVEHNGRPGLLVFQGNQQEPPLLHWQANGEENETPFMLVVPQDDAGREVLVAATTSDLLLLKEAAGLLSVELQVSSERGNAKSKNDWARVAKRFVELIKDVPARLHYDDIVATLEDKMLKFNLRRIWTAGHGFAPSLEIAWAEFRLELTLPADAPAPLTNWPLDEACQANPSLQIDLNPRGGWNSQREFWQKLTSNDRELLLQLIAELPNLIHHLATQNPSLKVSVEDYSQAAKVLHKQAQCLAAGRKPRKKFFGLF